MAMRHGILALVPCLGAVLGPQLNQGQADGNSSATVTMDVSWVPLAPHEAPSEPDLQGVGIWIARIELGQDHVCELRWNGRHSSEALHSLDGLEFHVFSATDKPWPQWSGENFAGQDRAAILAVEAGTCQLQFPKELVARVAKAAALRSQLNADESALLHDLTKAVNPVKRAVEFATEKGK